MRTPNAAANLLSFSLFLTLAGCGKPSLDVPAPLNTIGQATPVTVHVHDVHGVSKLTATLEQNGARYEAWQSTAASKNADFTFSFSIGTKTTPQLRDGKAHLILEATSGGLIHGTIRWEQDVNVVTQPPVISADSDQHYLYLGMADLATLNVTGAYTAAGIRVGNQDFRAWPLPGGKPGLFSLYAFAWNMPTMSTDLMKSVTQPSTERHAAIMMGPGSELIDPGPADYKFHLRPADNYIGTVTPGDQFTFTTEGLISAPPGATYDTVDFAIAISYVPIFPMIPMQTCSHFRIYKDRQGTPHWFRATNQCDRFPWLHDWFAKSPVKPVLAN